MTDPWTKTSAILAIGAFAISVVIFFLTMPPSEREMGLIALSAIFGCCIGYIIAIQIASRDKPRPISRAQQITTLDDEIDQLENEILSIQNVVKTEQAEAVGIAYMNRPDLTARHDSNISNARAKVTELQRKVKRLKGERSRVLQMSDRKWRKEVR